MPTNAEIALAIGLVAIVTFGTRVAGALAMSQVSLSDKTRQFLDATAASVIAAIVASIVAQNGPRETAAVLCTMLLMALTKSAIWAMLAGMALASAWGLLPA